jgi:predicted O-linked N-acetylglucosamine transferase (SPINDLY family)
MEPADAEAHYSETLVRLPNLALAFGEPLIPENGKSRQDFGLTDSDFVYLTSQSLFKYLPQHDDIYARIAHQVKNARFVFIGNPSPGITRRFKNRIAKAFDRHRLSMDRFCIFLPRLSPDDFMCLNRVSNVLLDPLSWSGGKTTFEGIACGLPVVTCPGRYMRARHAYALLMMMGISDTVATDMDDYVAIAGRLGRDDRFYQRMCRRIVANRHVLFNDTSCIGALEDFYRRVVDQRLHGHEGRRRG